MFLWILREQHRPVARSAATEQLQAEVNMFKELLKELQDDASALVF